MPNWTTNKMVMHDDDVNLITDAHGDVDFNRLRPMPKSLDIGNVCFEANEFAMAVSRGEATSMSQAPYDFLRQRLSYHNGETGEDVDIDHPSLSDYKRFGDLLCLNVGRYGHADWYSWCASDDGWGTKWNACHTTYKDYDGEGRVVVEFLSAWSCPAPIIKLLRKRATNPIRFECIDEDGYGNVHDEDYKDIEVSKSLFVPEYYDEEGCQIEEDEYEVLKAEGKGGWVLLV